MKRFLVLVLGLVTVLAFVGGQAFSQTRLVFKGANYASTTLKPMPIDKNHMVLIGEQMGLELNDKPAFNNMSTHFSLILYMDNGVWHFHGYGVYADKDGDTMVWEIWDSPSGADGGTGKLVGATGKFVGMNGTCDFANEHPRGWPDTTGRVICRENWNLTLKNPL